MLKKISVANFKALQHLDEVDLNQITLIGGKNNSGKSTLLEALFSYMDIKNPNVFRRLLAWRGLSSQNQDTGPRWSTFFSNFDMSNEIRITVTDEENSIRDLRISYQDEYTPKTPVPINNNGSLFGGNSINQAFKSLALRHTTTGVIDFNAHILHRATDYFYEIEHDTPNLRDPVFFMGSTMLHAPNNPELLSALEKEDEQEKILPILRVLEPNLKRFQLIKEGNEDIIYADFGNKKKFPVNVLGTGFCRYFSMALILAAGGNRMLFIDEIENGIHHTLIPEMWDFLIAASLECHCQIIATTHNYEVVQSLSEETKKKQFTDVSYMKLTKKSDAVAVHQVGFDDLSYVMSEKFEVR